MKALHLPLAFGAILLAATQLAAASPGSGSLWILTTPDGAALPSGTAVEGFPLLVRLNGDSFPFANALPDGADLRFTSADGTPLAHQIEAWDPANQRAAVWVRIPVIRGNDQQEVRIQWGATSTPAPATGPVFDASNGYAAVWHLGATARDEISGTTAKDTGTTATAGIIGAARHFDGDHGIAGGNQPAHFPSGSSPHSTEAWIRPLRPNATIVGWGIEKGQSKVVVQFRSPPHIQVDAYFSDANVNGKTRIPAGEWTHVLHTYEKGMPRLYVNGQLDTESPRRSTPLNIPSPARVWIGGWYDNYDFEGDIDEVRISSVTRSAEWAKLQYDNQKPLQTLVGHVVQPGNQFRVSTKRLTITEGSEATVSAEAGGARKISWTLLRDGQESTLAVDQLRCTIPAPRMTGSAKATLRCSAVYADGVRTQDVAITFKESIPDPAFTLSAPTRWDGRSPIEIIPRISNLKKLASRKAPAIQYSWKSGEIATTREVASDRLRLLRAERDGTLTVTATLDNGGQPVTRTCTIQVATPGSQPWIARTPGPDEFPVDNQFYTREPSGFGTVFWTGRLTNRVDSVFLRFRDDGIGSLEATASPDSTGAFQLSARVTAALLRYRFEMGTRTGGQETILRTATNVVCGDAYLIQGQSNAVATDWGKEEPDFASPWVRTYGTMSGDPKGLRLWGDAVPRSHEGERFQVGYWGMLLARQLVESNGVPVCILNGAVGGTRIDQHQRSATNPTDPRTIYGRLLARAQQARLTHGIRAVFWHQGENDQGADGPTGGFGWENYRNFFIDLTAAWKQDFPNISRYYVFQIWPKSCSMGFDGSDNRLREVQRTLGSGYDNLTVLSTLGIDPPGGCHYPAAGYAEFARMLFPLVQRDHYGKPINGQATPPNLTTAQFANASRTQIVLTFDQPIAWAANLTNEFRFPGSPARVTAGRADRNQLHLDLDIPASIPKPTVSYLDSDKWSQSRLLKGINHLAALTFCEVPIQPAR
jgi:hypothetical protein